MSFLYPRRIRVLRPTSDRALGATDYGGETREREECLAEDVEAAIQFKSEAPRPQAELPGDTVRRTLWKILIPRDALPIGSVRIRDIIEDDTKVRYQVTAPYLNAMGHSILAELLDL